MNPPKFWTSVTVGDVVRELKKRDLVCFNHQRTVREALELMGRENIHSLPIHGVPPSKYMGIVNVFDLMAYLVGMVGLCGDNAAEEELKRVALDKLQAPISDAVGISAESRTAWVYAGDTPFDKVLEAFSKGVHRVVVEHDGTASFLSQTDAIRYFNNHDSKLGPWIDGAVGKLGLFNATNPKPMVTAKSTDTALTCFRRMVMYEQNALPIVNENGRMVATLSASDVRHLEPLSIHLIRLPVEQYIAQVVANKHVINNVQIKSTSSFREVLSKLHNGRIHRVWIMDDNTVPVGVISMSDVMMRLYTYDPSKSEFTMSAPE